MNSARSAGFTSVELLVTLAIAAILLAIAVPSFVATTQQTRSEVASEGLLRAAASARQTALQTAKSTKIVINKNVSDCGSPVAWAVTQTVTQKDSSSKVNSLICLSKTDFAKRYPNTTLSFEGSVTDAEIEFAPTGIGANTDEPVVDLVSGSKTVRIRFNAGGTTQIL